MADFIRQKYLTMKQLSEKIGYSIASLRKMKADGSGPPFVQLKDMGRVYYETEAVEKWIKKRMKR